MVFQLNSQVEQNVVQTTKLSEKCVEYKPRKAIYVNHYQMIKSILIAAFLMGCTHKVTNQQNMESMQFSLPIITEKSELKNVDGQKIVALGTFRKSISKKKMRGPGEFIGEAHLELASGSVIDLGKRSPDEFTSFTDKFVRVTGTVLLDPYNVAPQENLPVNPETGMPIEVARVIHGPPQLIDISAIEMAKK